MCYYTNVDFSYPIFTLVNLSEHSGQPQGQPHGGHGAAEMSGAREVTAGYSQIGGVPRQSQPTLSEAESVVSVGAEGAEWNK